MKQQIDGTGQVANDSQQDTEILELQQQLQLGSRLIAKLLQKQQANGKQQSS